MDVFVTPVVYLCQIFLTFCGLLTALSSQAANKRLSSVDVNCQRREAVEQPFSVDDATCGVDIDDEEEEGIQDVVIDKVFTSYSNSYGE